MLKNLPALARGFLKRTGFVLDKKPRQIDRLLAKSLSPAKREQLEAIWAMPNSGHSDGLGMYLIPENMNQAALLFSYDWQRSAATMTWFDEIVTAYTPASIVEMGCGAGFLLSFIRERHPDVLIQGIEAAPNLAKIASENCGTPIIADSYLEAEPDHHYEMVICDFGFDNAQFMASQTPHTIAACAGQDYCPGCSDDLKLQIDDYIKAWRQWATSSARLALTGRIRNFGELRAFVLSAADVGWKFSLDASEVLRISSHGGNTESFPALLFEASTDSNTDPNMEEVAAFWSAT